MTGQRRHESPELGAAARRFLRALAVRATEGDTEAIEQLAQLQADVNAALGSAVAGARAFGYSWGEVAGLVGTTRQNVQQRFGDAEPPAAFKCLHGCTQLFPTEVSRGTHHVKDHGVERCPKVTQPAPRQCTMPAGHKDAGQPHVMGLQEAEADDVADELLGGAHADD